MLGDKMHVLLSKNTLLMNKIKDTEQAKMIVIFVLCTSVEIIS